MVGAGVVGLTSALRLAQAGARVTVVSADEPASTVSAVAAAVWYPTRVDGQPAVLRWATRTYAELGRQAAAGVPGVVARPTRMLRRSAGGGPPWWAPAVPDFRVADAADVPPGYAGEWRFTAPSVEMGPYLHWLQERLVAAGGRLVYRRLTALADAAALAAGGGPAAVVVNATGLGARVLCGDGAVYPARGQVVLVANPGLVTSVRDEDDPAGVSYVHPRRDDVVLGGTYDVGAEDPAPDPTVTAAIVRRCTALVPQLAGAAVRGVRVGLRPARTGGPRLAVQAGSGDPAVVHNYGHGGAGVTLSWGCADEVLRLVSRYGPG